MPKKAPGSEQVYPFNIHQPTFGLVLFRKLDMAMKSRIIQLASLKLTRIHFQNTNTTETEKGDEASVEPGITKGQSEVDRDGGNQINITATTNKLSKPAWIILQQQALGTVKDLRNSLARKEDEANVLDDVALLEGHKNLKNYLETKKNI